MLKYSSKLNSFPILLLKFGHFLNHLNSGGGGGLFAMLILSEADLYMPRWKFSLYYVIKIGEDLTFSLSMKLTNKFLFQHLFRCPINFNFQFLLGFISHELCIYF